MQAQPSQTPAPAPAPLPPPGPTLRRRGRFHKVYDSDHRTGAETRLPHDYSRYVYKVLSGGISIGPIPGLFSHLDTTLAGEVGQTIEAFRGEFGKLEAAGLARADWRAALVWLPHVKRTNGADSPKTVLGWGRHWELLPECPLLEEVRCDLWCWMHLLDRYHHANQGSYVDSIERVFGRRYHLKDIGGELHLVPLGLGHASCAKPRPVRQVLAGQEDLIAIFPELHPAEAAEGIADHAVPPTVTPRPSAAAVPEPPPTRPAAVAEPPPPAPTPPAHDAGAILQAMHVAAQGHLLLGPIDLEALARPDHPLGQKWRRGLDALDQAGTPLGVERARMVGAYMLAVQRRTTLERLCAQRSDDHWPYHLSELLAEAAEWAHEQEATTSARVKEEDDAGDAQRATEARAAAQRRAELDEWLQELEGLLLLEAQDPSWKERAPVLGLNGHSLREATAGDIQAGKLAPDLIEDALQRGLALPRLAALCQEVQRSQEGVRVSA